MQLLHRYRYTRKEEKKLVETLFGFRNVSALIDCRVPVKVRLACRRSSYRWWLSSPPWCRLAVTDRQRWWSEGTAGALVMQRQSYRVQNVN